jgi:hypothetical protein
LPDNPFNRKQLEQREINDFFRSNLEAHRIKQTIIFFSNISGESGEQIFYLFGVVKKYSQGHLWTDFCMNYQKDILQLQKTFSEATPLSTSQTTADGSKVIYSIANDSREVLAIAAKGDDAIISWKGNLTMR